MPMISDYSPDAVYEVFETQNSGKKYKIGEIHGNVFYDIDRNGKRIGDGTLFTNSESFWKQFQNISIKKNQRPLYGYEPIIWGIYWTIHVFVTIVVLVGVPDNEKILYFISSSLVFAFTVKYRYNRIVVYLMLTVSIIFILFLIFYKPKRIK